MFKKSLQFLIILLPILFLILLGGYFAYDSWGKYQQNKLLKSQLVNAKLLKSLEHSVLNEVVCVATMSQHKNLMDKICKPTKKTTDSVLKQILEQKDDSSLYNIEKIIFNIRNTIQNSGTAVVEKLVNGDLDKEMNVFIQKYTKKLKNYSLGMDKKEYLRLYSDISNISYATESEKAFVSYYLSLNKPIPAKNLIYWDKIVNTSQIHEFDKEKISVLHEDIESIFNQKNFQKNLRKIEDVRLDIMTNSFSGNYKSNIATWVSTLNEKQKVLNNIESMLLDNIFDDVSKEFKMNMVTLVLSLLALFISILGLLFLMSFWKNSNKKKALLDDLVGKISEHTSDEKLVVTENINSHRVAYNYIASQYESLHEKESLASNENKTNKVFLNNVEYEIRTPLNGISGYTKLLKETPLNIEQNDFVSMIESNFENLDSILTKISGDQSSSNQKLEVENFSFDIVKKIESSVETFSIKADQKDILLGLYIDPNLAQKVKGDGTKLSQIITNLVYNALESSSAYNTIDISIEKVHSDDNQVTVKFAVKDEGIGYSQEELAQIRNAFSTMESLDNIANIDMKNLSISNKIIKRMGGKLEVTSKKGEGSTFFFSLTFEKDDKQQHIETYPTFDGMKVGLALPNKEIIRQVDKNLEMYVDYFKGDFDIYYYDELFGDKNNKVLPDLLFVYHNYARLEGELENFSKLSSKIALITSGTLRSRINMDKYTFSSIVYAPITMSKIVKIFAESKLDTPILLDNSMDEVVVDEIKKFDNLHALVVEDNQISQKLISNMLKKFGIEVTLASNGKEAFDLRREKEFNIIFMDIDIPIMDGVETTSKILYYEGVNQFTHIPIIALLNDSSIEDQEKCMKVGMDSYIDKPIEENDIYDAVQKYCIELPKKTAETEEDALIAKVLSGDFLKE